MHQNSIFRRLLINRAPQLLTLLVILSLVGFYLGSKVTLKLSLTDLLPANHPAVVKFDKITEVIGGVGYLAIVLEAEDGKSHLEVAPKLVEKLSKSPLVKNAFYEREQRYFTDRLLYYMTVEQLEDLDKNIKTQLKSARRQMFDLGLFDDEKKEEKKEVFSSEIKDLAKKSAGTSSYLTSKDMRHLLVMVKPSFDSMDMSATINLVDFARKIVEESLPANVKYEFGERYYNKIVETNIIQNDIFLLGGTSIVIILLILLLYLRSFKALMVIFVPVFLGMGITMGLTYLIIGHINIITGFLMGIISGLGVDYGIHLVLRLDLEKREPSAEEPDPIWRTLSSSGHSVFVGAVAASVAFFFLGFSSFRAFSEFGIICGIGILAVFISLMVSFSPVSRFLKVHTSPPLKLMKFGFSNPVIPIPRGLAVALVLTFALIIYGATNVSFEYDFDKMMRHSEKMEQISKRIDVIYDRWSAPSALASNSKEEAIAVEKVLKDEYSKELVSELVSGATIVPDDQEKKKVILNRISHTLEKISDRSIEQSMDVPGKTVRGWLKAEPFKLQEIPPHVQDALRGTKHSGYLLYVYPKIKLSTLQGVKKWSAMIRDLETRFPNLLTGSDAVVFSDILDLINNGGVTILIVIFLTVGIFIWLNVREPAETLLSYVPLLLALPVGMGLMAVFGIKFNIFNIAIIPSFVAMGIDVPIHIVHRAKEVQSGFKAARDLAASINLALCTAGVGFGILIFARAGVLKSLGWIALLGTAGIWWVGLFLLPSFLEWMLNRKKT